MNVLLSTWLLVMTSSIVVLGASLGGSAGSSLGQNPADGSSFGRLLARHSRSFDPAIFDCVSVQKLVDYQNRFRSMVDHNADGRATPEEVKTFFQTFKDVNDDTVTAFIARRDIGHDGVLDFVPDYVQSVTVQANSLEDAKEWFFLHDTNDDGFVTDDELLQFANKLGVSPESIQGYYMPFDNNMDGKLSFDEFKLLYA